MLRAQGERMSKVYNVLFLCTGNSARSILAEAILNREGKDHFRAFSAGSFPKGRVHPAALKLLEELGYPTAGFRSKAGTSSHNQARRRSISSSRFAIMPRAKSARFGRANR